MELLSLLFIPFFSTSFFDSTMWTMQITVFPFFRNYPYYITDSSRKTSSFITIFLDQTYLLGRKDSTCWLHMYQDYSNICFSDVCPLNSNLRRHFEFYSDQASCLHILIVPLLSLVLLVPLTPGSFYSKIHSFSRSLRLIHHL